MTCNAVGIVLKVIPFQDYHQILTLYTPDLGIIKLLHKFALSKKSPFHAEPLNFIEVIFTKGRSDLFQIANISLLDANLKLREEFSTLNASLEMAAALLKSQMDHKSTPLLFSLFLHYLEQLSKTSSPEVFLASFKLKILRHEGLLSFEKRCATCGAEVLNGGISQGELYCQDHSPIDALAFLKEEMQTIYELALSRSLIHLNDLKLSTILQKKIQTLFEVLILC